jgi:hypothetical protein
LPVLSNDWKEIKADKVIFRALVKQVLQWKCLSIVVLMYNSYFETTCFRNLFGYAIDV